ncbi:unnamed protein product [Parnassius apollo]|uniref:(apollo) hypothetical protein n=1 Tax=Parnassius apollo TaxID=110799 RepID=A0A8S3XBC9_PARAO|nr:unnamed protein product [Parnassius apollo]
MMEYGRTRKRPLPGGHQGAFGAGAGRDSIRTASRTRVAARPPISPSEPSSPPAGLVSAGSSRAQQSAPATGGVRRLRWTIEWNARNAYFRATGEEVGEQPANVDAAVNTPVVVDSNDDGTVAQELELEHMRSTLEEAIVETRSTPLENRPRLPRIALSKRNRVVVRALNPMLVTYLKASRDLCETDPILFGAALAVCRIIGAKLSTTGQNSAIPAWRIRVEEIIAKARALIGRLICFRSGNNRPRIVRIVRMAFAETNVGLSQPDIMQKLTERIDDLKQRIAA